MSKLDYRNIEKVPGRCGGRAVVASTRIRVSVILACYRQGMTVEDILRAYPHLKPADIHDALAYAYDHADEIERDLAADRAAVPARSAASSAGAHDSSTDLDALVQSQGIRPVERLEDVLGDFWPEGENLDDFLAAREDWRKEGHGVAPAE